MRRSTIISHACWQFVQTVGAQTAGHVLQFIPWRLPASRTFGEVCGAFKLSARGLFWGPGAGGTGGTVEAAIDSAFAHVGVFDATTRNCPPPPPPICEIKPWLPQGGELVVDPPIIDEKRRAPRR